MVYKLVITFIFLFSLKTFAVEAKNNDQLANQSENGLAKKQLEIIIQSIKQENTAKSQKADS